MKVVELSNKVYLVRHWCRWYRVQRSAAQWQKLDPIIKSGRLPKEFDLDKAADALSKRAGGKSKPPIDLTE